PGLFLTGDGGDEVLGRRRVSLPAEVLRTARHGRLPRPALLRAARAALAPASVRASHEEDRLAREEVARWLVPDVRRRYYRDAARIAAAEPLLPARWPSYHLSRPIV